MQVSNPSPNVSHMVGLVSGEAPSQRVFGRQRSTHLKTQPRLGCCVTLVWKEAKEGCGAGGVCSKVEGDTEREIGREKRAPAMHEIRGEKEEKV